MIINTWSVNKKLLQCYAPTFDLHRIILLNVIDKFPEHRVTLWLVVSMFSLNQHQSREAAMVIFDNLVMRCSVIFDFKEIKLTAWELAVNTYSLNNFLAK